MKSPVASDLDAAFGSASVPHQPDRGTYFFSWLLLFAALHQVYVFLSVTLAARDVDLWFFFSSDTVQYGLLYQDLFSLGFHYRGWNISHAPEYVQMVWALLLRALTPGLAAGHVLEALSQPVLLALALHHLLRRALGRRTILSPLCVAAVLTLIARGVGLDLIAFIWSNRHGFTALIGVVALTCLIESLVSKRLWLPLGLVVSLGVASDLLFFIWFVAPALAAVAVLFIEPKRRAWAMRAALAILGGAAAGMVLFWILTPLSTVGDKVVIDLGRTSGALGRMADDAFGSSTSQSVMAGLLILGLVIGAITAWRSRRIELRLLGLYGVVLPVVTIMAMALTSAPFRETGYTRYLAGPELAALVALMATAAITLGRRGAHVAPAGLPDGLRGERLLFIILAALILPGFRFLPEGVTPVSRYEPPLVRCIDAAAVKHGLRYGVADYWLAKYITAFSSTELRVVPVTPRLDPFLNFTNIEWFLGGVGARRHDRPDYTFAILGSTTPSGPGVSPDALKAFGAPVAVESCFGFQIHVLPAGSSGRIRSQFGQNRRIRAYYEKHRLPVPEP